MKKQDLINELKKHNQDCDIEVHDSYSYKELNTMLRMLNRDSSLKFVKLGYTWTVIRK